MISRPDTRRVLHACIKLIALDERVPKGLGFEFTRILGLE